MRPSRSRSTALTPWPLAVYTVIQHFPMTAHEKMSPLLETPTPGLLDLGQDSLLNVLSFCSLHDVARFGLTNRSLHHLVEEEYRLRDARMTNNKSRASTARQRMYRWATGQACLDQATAGFFRNESKCSRPRFLLYPSATSEAMLRLYSLKQQSVLWEGFLPWKEAAPGWQLDVAPLCATWNSLVQPVSQSPAAASLELVSQVIEDLVFVLVIVESGGRHPEAHLVTCTQGVALSQRQHGSRNPSSFVLRQRRIEEFPIVVHLSLHTCGNVLENCQICYFKAPIA